MKKILAFAMAVMMAGSLVACGAKTETPATTQAAEEKKEEAPVEAVEDKPEEVVEATPAEQPAAPATDVQVAAIFGGAINDGNWNETQFNGLEKIKATGASTSYLENVSDTDAAEAARTYASEGYNLIYLTTNSYQDYCSGIADEFKDVKFVQINGTLMKENFISVRIADEEQGFMQGAVAALLSKTGKVGFIGGLEINPIKLGAAGFKQGVEYVNATYGTKVEAVLINTGSFTDVNKAKETAISLIEGGCDVVAPMANDASVGVMEAAEAKGVMAIGAGLGQNTSAPTATQIIVVKDVSIAYDVTYAAFQAGTLNATEVETYGANKGVVYLTEWFANADADIQTKSAEIMDKLAKGEITINLA